MLQIGKKVLIQALDHCAAGLVIVSAAGDDLEVVYANGAIEALTGWDSTELTGRAMTDWVASGDQPSAEDALPGRERWLRQRWRCRDGGERELVFRLSALFTRPGAPAYWLLSQDMGADASQPAAAGSRAGRQDHLDAHTGLLNRHGLDELLRRDWGMARRDQRSLALIMFRVDALDAYRDVFGRHATDATLRKIGHAISGSLRRAGDAAARFDASQFAVVIGSANVQQALDLAERIAAKVQDLAIHHPRTPAGRYVALSYGVATLVPDRQTPHAALIDKAMANLAPETGAADGEQSVG